MSTTKDQCLFFKNKQQDLVVTDNLNGQFNNLNLNQNNQHLAKVIQSKNVENHNKDISNYVLTAPSDFSHKNDTQTKQNLTSFGKSKLTSSFANLNAQKNYGKNEETKDGKILNANNSTLSLHISAYENSIDANSDAAIDREKDGINKKKENISSIKNWKAVKTIFKGSSSAINYAFELPRQQQKQSNDPEVMQFKASQRLSNVNAAPQTRRGNQQLHTRLGVDDDALEESGKMVKRPIKTVDDIKKVMAEKQQNAEKKRHEQMAADDAEPNGISAAEMLNGQSKSESHPNPNGILNGLNESINGGPESSSTTPQKKRKNKKKKNKNKKKANAGYDGTSADDSRISEKHEEPEFAHLNGNETKSKNQKKNKAKKQLEEQIEAEDVVEVNGDSTAEASTNGHGKNKSPKRKGKKKKHEEKADENAESNGTEGLNGENESHIEEAPATNPRKRKAAQRAEASLAVVPLSQRKDDSDEDDQDYIVESPDEDGNPKRSRIGESEEDDSEEEDWSRRTLEQRIADMLGGGVFYHDDEDESEEGESEEESDEDGHPIFLNHHDDDEEEEETEVEVSDSDDEAGRIDIDDGSSNEEEGEDDEEDEDGAEFSSDSFDESALYQNYSDEDEDEEIMSFDEERPPNSDDEIDDIVSTIRPKKDDMSLLDDLYAAGVGQGSSGDEEDSVYGAVDDLNELAEDDEDDLYAEDSDTSENLGNFIARDDEDVDDEEEDEDDEEDMDDSEDDMDIDLGDDEYTDISPMFQMTTDYKFKVDGYRTVKENSFLLKLERTTATKSRSGSFTTFKFGQIADTHSVQIAMDAFSWMVAPIERDAFFSHLFQRRVLFVKRRDKIYFKGLFSSDGLLRMVQENDLEYGTNINVAHYDREGGRTTHNLVGRVFANQLKTFVKAGMSIQCINPQSYNDEIWYLCEILQELTNSFVGANTYLTPANSAGFAPHWDEVDAFILQLEGKKYWRVWSPADGDAALPDDSSRNFTEKEMADKNLVFECTLEEGDILYVPRGFYHSASTGKEHSLHVTISLCHNVTFTHLMKNISDEVWDSVRQSRLVARRSLPPGFLEMGGVAALDYEEGLNEHIMPVVNTMLEDITETYRDGMASAIDKMAQEFFKTALPPLLTPEERKLSIHGGDNLTMFDDSEIKVTRMKEIRFIRQHAQRLVFENEETPFIIHRMSNSRILSENTEQKTIPVELKMVDGISTLFREYPQWIKVKDLGCGKLVNVQLAEILYNNGLIMMRDKPV